MLELRRRVHSPPEGATDESVASSQLELAKHLELCCGARLAGLPAAHPDAFGDAALLLWRKVCVARLAALDKHLNAQARGGSPAAAAVTATAGLALASPTAAQLLLPPSPPTEGEVQSAADFLRVSTDAGRGRCAEAGRDDAGAAQQVEDAVLSLGGSELGAALPRERAASGGGGAAVGAA